MFRETRPFAGTATPRRRALVLLAALAAAQAGNAVLIAGAVHRLVDGRGTPGAALALLVLLAALGFALDVALRRLADEAELSCAGAIRTALFQHLLRVSPELIRQRRQGATPQSCIGELTAVQHWIGDGIMRGGAAALILAALIGWIGRGNGALAAVLVLIVISSVAVGALLMVPLHHAVRAVGREQARLSAFAAQRLAATATIIACGRADSEVRKLEWQQDRLARAALHRAWLAGWLRALPLFTTALLMLAAVLLGGRPSAGAMAGQLTLIGLIGPGLRDLAGAAELWIPGRIARTRIAALMALPPVATAPAQPRTFGERRKLVLDRLVLRDGARPLALTATMGDVILVDGDAALRTALFHALTGLAPIAPRAIRLDGHDLAAPGDKLRRQLIGAAGPDFPLLAGSTAMNLHYRHPYAEEAAWRDHARVWVGGDETSNAADTSSHAGTAIARAMLNRPRLLILDGADADLTPERLGRLRADLAGYPGIVLLNSARPDVRAMATRVWTLGADQVERDCDDPLDNLVHLRERYRA